VLPFLGEETLYNGESLLLKADALQIVMQFWTKLLNFNALISFSKAGYNNL
jgi:hypothetical protein